jgi:7,8-dihydropterin-6-yl-methyl-4-(beta-D-ribofuranosyl)aminobenzene 5'-phosphate synthase
MKVKATVLVDNYAFGINGVLAQHGWAVFLETDQGNYLLDTGAGKIIIPNADVLGIDLRSIRGIILSHHHHDHTGGILEVLEYLRRPVNVYAHTELFKDSYSTRTDPLNHSGVPFKREVLESKGAIFDLSGEFRSIAPELFMTGQVPRLTGYEKGDPHQVVREGPDLLAPDPLSDDQSVVIRTERGLFVILGCAHAGIVNILNFATKRMNEERIHTVFGGTHLGPVGEEQREESIRALKAMKIDRLGVSHCTGMKTSIRLAREWGDRFVFCSVGTVFQG